MHMRLPYRVPREELPWQGFGDSVPKVLGVVGQSPTVFKSKKLFAFPFFYAQFYDTLNVTE